MTTRPADPVIALDRVEKRYAGAAALAPTTLTVERRTSLALLGPSGCGKSTILRLIIGLITPDAGTVRAFGAPVTRESLGDLRRRIGYVIQDGGLFPHLTARENVTLMASKIGWSPARTGERVAELAALVRLDLAMLTRYPVELSGGQRQRVGLMRALMLDPDLLLLDEPMGALDPVVRKMLQEDLSRIFAELEKTVILVTHDLDEAAFLGAEVALMQRGKILQRGPIEELARHPADPFVSTFLGAQRAPGWRS
ncbi:MAG: ATP-binding cassette domain-containing protein [Byssovorax sp.]